MYRVEATGFHLPLNRVRSHTKIKQLPPCNYSMLCLRKIDHGRSVWVVSYAVCAVFPAHTGRVAG
jgi:hypothetical protein